MLEQYLALDTMLVFFKILFNRQSADKSVHGFLRQITN